jgi:hypothetical protein
MAITLVFLAVVLSHALVTALNYRNGFLLFLFFYPLYPRFLSIGVSNEGFALSGQRGMVYMMFGFYILRMLWGSAEIRRGIKIVTQYKRIFYALIIFLGARLGGNIVTSRIDLGSIAAMVNESLLSAFVVLLVVTYIRNRSDINTLLTVVVLSLLITQLLATIEFAQGAPIIPPYLNLQFETVRDASDLLEGRSREGVYRAMALFDNALKLAGFLCLILPLAGCLLARGLNSTARLIAGMAIVMVVPTAIFCGSRTAIGTLFLTFTWYLYLYVSRGLTPAGRRFLALCAGGLGVLIIFAAISGVLESLLFGTAYIRSTESRYYQFILVPLELFGSPFFGFGFSRNIIEVVSMTSLDSFLLQIALEGGIVSLLALLTAFYQAGRLFSAVKKSIPDKWFFSTASGLQISLAVGFFIGLVLNLPSIRMYMFMTIGLAIVLHYMLHTEKRQLNEQPD